jgi:hypothetical protein
VRFAALLLQPEPYEFLSDRQHKVLERVASTAALRVARTFSRQASMASAHSLHSIAVRTGSLSAKRGSSDTGAAPARALSARQVSSRLQHLVSITDDGALAGSTARPRSVGVAAAAAVAAADAAAHSKEAIVEQHAGRAPRDRSLAAQTRQCSLSLKIHHSSADELLPADCEQAFAHEVRGCAVCCAVVTAAAGA